MVSSMICSGIINVIDPKLHASIAYVKVAALMWDNLCRKYAMPNTPKIHQEKLILLPVSGGLKVVEFYSKLMGMWSELSNYIKIPKCTCGKYECWVGAKVVKLIEEEKTHQLLMGLDNECYATIQSQVLAMDPLPPFAVKEKPSTVEKNTCKHCSHYRSWWRELFWDHLLRI